MAASTEREANSAHLVSELPFPGYESFHKIAKTKGGVILLRKKYATLPAMMIDKHDAEKYYSM